MRYVPVKAARYSSLTGVQLTQNVIVELQYQSRSAQGPHTTDNSKPQLYSAYVGWTGDRSQHQKPPWSGRNPSLSNSGKINDLPAVEIDTIFARTIGLGESQKVDVLLHLDPPSAHTVHIEPLTPGDWEIIELHSNFLEDNLLLQIRALPNPSFSSRPSEQARKVHPLTLHLSPTSTANIVVSSLLPPQSAATPFVKVAPGAEVIVAPKTRPKLSSDRQSSNRSVTSTDRKSAGNRSSRSHHKQRDVQEEEGTVFLRAVDRVSTVQWFDDKNSRATSAQNLQIWVDKEVRRASGLSTSEYVLVSYVRPGGLEAPISPQEEQSKREVLSMAGGRPALDIVARILEWKDAPDQNHAALSSALSSALGVTGVLGGLLRLCRVPPSVVERPRVLKIYPFAGQTITGQKELRFGGQSRAARDGAAEILRREFASEGGLFNGPLTDGMIMGPVRGRPILQDWHGGVVRFDPPPVKAHDRKTSTTAWYDFTRSRPSIEVQPELPNLLFHFRPSSLQDFGLLEERPCIVDVEELMHDTYDDLLNGCSVLLAGGLGSGKTSIAKALGHQLRSFELFHVSFLSCRDAFSDETRVSAIKEKLNRLFAGASWSARPTGQSLIILDDLDKICPAETELQTQDNGRSRQVTELLLSITKHYCGYGSRLVLLVTAQSKESLHNLVVSGNIIRDIRQVKAPSKEQRRNVLEALISGPNTHKMLINGHTESPSPSRKPDPPDWLSTSPVRSPRRSPSLPIGFTLSPSLSLLTIASLTDGYFPGDLNLLLSRAKSECLIRSPHTAQPTLTHTDFLSALKNFTPASLRSVTLHTSTASFSSVGGLHHPRRILLETLQYPTKYAPLFAQCPIRLRSGILLYGYPGCGKTLLASAVASECSLNFISVKGPEILNKYIGASEKSVRSLFDRAQAAKPCVLFFDEFDSIAPKRGHDSTGVTDRVVNQLLTQMDGAEGLEGVYVLAATSRPDLIDPALLRPGRLDKSVLCGMPVMHERKDILEKVAEKLQLAREVTEEGILDEVAARTEGYSGADLQAVMYSAHLEAVHEYLDKDERSGKQRSGKLANGGGHQNEDANEDRSGDDNDGVPSEEEHDKDILCFTLGDEDSISQPSNITPASRAAIMAELVTMDAASASRPSTTLSQQSPSSSSSSSSSSNSSTSSSSPSSTPPSSPLPNNSRHRRRRPSTNSSRKKQSSTAAATAEHNKNEPRIHSHHIFSSLKTTRPSISIEERTRLRRIYEDFTQSRDGKMRDGSGGTEVGGRVTLM